MNKTDSDIEAAVALELQWDPHVHEPDIVIEVVDGVVILAGKVSSWAHRVAAEEAANRADGALGVANDLVIEPLRSGLHSDREIADAVRHALEWDVLVPDAMIRSSVADGWVSLTGEVENWCQKEDAERAVRNLAGVRGVVDRIQVRARAVTASKVRASIEDALERHAEREARRLDVQVKDSQVTVSGVVHTRAEGEVVVGAVRGTPGVVRVTNRLRIQPRSAR